MTCSICQGEKTVIVGWSNGTGRNDKVKWERDPCPGCTPPPHTFHAKQKAGQIAAPRAQDEPGSERPFILGANHGYETAMEQVAEVDLDAIAEVLRISDRDHEAWHRAKAAIGELRNLAGSSAHVNETPKSEHDREDVLTELARLGQEFDAAKP